MHYREKIQAVFESVELEKAELKQERDELKKERTAIAKDRDLLARAIEKIGNINTEGAADISHAANKIQTIKINTDRIQNESLKAIRAVKNQKKLAGTTAFLLTLIIAFTIGITSAHLSYTKLLKEKVLVSEIESLRQQKEEFGKAGLAIITLQKQGLKVYEDAIVLPNNYREMLRTSNNGLTYISLTK